MITLNSPEQKTEHFCCLKGAVSEQCDESEICYNGVCPFKPNKDSKCLRIYTRESLDISKVDNNGVDIILCDSIIVTLMDYKCDGYCNVCPYGDSPENCKLSILQGKLIMSGYL